MVEYKMFGFLKKEIVAKLKSLSCSALACVSMNSQKSIKDHMW